MYNIHSAVAILAPFHMGLWESMLGLFVLVHPWGVSALVTSTLPTYRGWTQEGSTFVAAAPSVAKPQEADAATGCPFSMLHGPFAYAGSASPCVVQMAIRTMMSSAVTMKVVQEGAFSWSQRGCLARRENLKTPQQAVPYRSKSETAACLAT